jgi:cysteine desulfurase
MYFDYCATTPISEEVLEAMRPFLGDDFGNPSSLHQYGRKAAQAITHARNQVAALLHANSEEIIFTSGATEANNLAIMGNLRPWENTRAHLITSAIEHHSVLHTAEALERMGCDVTYLPVDSRGLISIDELRRAIRSETRMISVMHVNNEIGTIQPLAEIGKIAAEHAIIFHCDAVQGIGLQDVDVKELGIDLLSISAHKIYGPKGVGALYIQDGIEIQNLFYGGSQEKAIRPGTENVPGIIGLGKAAELVQQNKHKNKQHIAELRDQLIFQLSSIIPNLMVNGPEGDLVCPHVLSLTFPGSVAEMMQIQLSMNDIAISLGSACNSKEIAPSHVLLAMGLSPADADATIRISIGNETTQEEITKLAEILPNVASACKI